MMKKRLQIGKLMKGDKRLDGETFVEYKDRLRLEKSLLNDYGKGVYISPEQHQQDVIKKDLTNKNKKGYIRIMNLGYACINMELNARKGDDRITTNRSMIKKTFNDKGVDYASELILQNVIDLNQIIDWNEDNNIKFFRMSSDIFPWASEYYQDWDSVPHIDLIKIWLENAGLKAEEYGQRITSHPGPFNVLVSPNENVVQNTITDLTIHGQIFDMMGLSRTPYNKLNIHCNGVYGDKQSALDRFCKNFERLPESVQTRLTVENDDKASMYSVKELYDGIYKRINIPIVFDYHHHRFCDGGLSEQEALELAMSTWGDITPVVHYSESRSEEQLDESIKPQAHSDLIKELPNTYGNKVDIMVEAKHKELSIKQFIKGESKMNLAEIKEKLQQAYDDENWNVIEEIISELEIQLELDYLPGQDDEVRDEDWN